MANYSYKHCKPKDGCPPGAFFALVGSHGPCGAKGRSGLQFKIVDEPIPTPTVDYYVLLEGLPLNGTTAGYYTDIDDVPTLIESIELQQIGKELHGSGSFILNLENAFRLFTNRVYLLVSNGGKEYRGIVMQGCLPDPCKKGYIPRPKCHYKSDCPPGAFFALLMNKLCNYGPRGKATMQFSILPNLPPTPLLSYEVKVCGFPPCSSKMVHAGFYTKVDCEPILVQPIELEYKYGKLVGSGEFALDLDTAFRLFTDRLFIKVSVKDGCCFTIQGTVQQGCLDKKYEYEPHHPQPYYPPRPYCPPKQYCPPYGYPCYPYQYGKHGGHQYGPHGY